ncbi:hypothetical protein Q2T40_06060 [Winogradskyella maritima]|uniref:Periplasmic heavy metal sensor n=1 Tax=Winogradskyella maritima TaxID=1517766 RepID=A0ABV8AJH9_9FLAO|nr:hypothetical protein [Winogradskyella maritima]
MKKLIVLAIAFCTLSVTAQEKRKTWDEFKKERGITDQNLTPEERATLESKRMTLQLDLSADQQQKVEATLAEHYKAGKATRDAMKKDRKPTNEERMAMRNSMLDAQIALKQKMKSILDKVQYARYEKMMAKRGMKRRGHKKENKG